MLMISAKGGVRLLGAAPLVVTVCSYSECADQSYIDMSGATEV